MPHSSGGGSHGGGSHGGSHSHGSGSSGRRTVRTSKTYFPGAQRYVYYHRQRPVYFYRERVYTYDETHGSIGKILATAAFLIFFYSMFFGSFFGALFHFPKKIVPPADADIRIVDNLGLINEEYDTIYQTFIKFRNDTGVVPALLIIQNSDWKNYYDLEDYAYDYYVNHFADEKHWLIVYSTAWDGEYEDWYWEGMQGDDTDPVITESIAESFTSRMHRRLTDRTHYSIGRAISESVGEVGKKAGSFGINASGNGIIPLLFVLGFLTLHCSVFVTTAVVQPLRERKRAQRSHKLDANKQYGEAGCSHCGGVYVRGIHSSCPYCGSPIPVEQGYEDQGYGSQVYEDRGYGNQDYVNQDQEAMDLYGFSDNRDSNW